MDNKDKRDNKSVFNFFKILAILFAFGMIYFLKKNTKLNKVATNNNKTTKKYKKKPAISPSNPFTNKNFKFETIKQIQNLFTFLGIEYISTRQFDKEYKFFEKIKKTDYLPYNKNKKKCEALTRIYEEDILKSVMPPIYIKWISDKIGYGVYANDDLPKGTLIGEYAGEILATKKIKKRIWTWRYPSIGYFSKKFPQNISVDGGKKGNELRFINHGDDPNVESKIVYAGTSYYQVYVAKKFIKKDEQLLVNYGRKYWNKRTKINLS